MRTEIHTLIRDGSEAFNPEIEQPNRGGIDPLELFARGFANPCYSASGIWS